MTLLDDIARNGARNALPWGRRGARSRGRLPDFMIVGAARCGTTTLYQYLLRHPGVFMSTPKEPEFFSDDEVYARGLDWYRGLFAGARDEQLCGEASTTYTRWPHTPDVPERVARVAPHAKFVYIVRDPVQRAYSHFAHQMRAGVTRTFEESLAASSVYVDCGMYLEQIRRYLRFFDRSAFLFLLLDDLKRDPGAVMARVQSFLGLEVLPLAEGGPIVANHTGSDHFVRSRTFDRLAGVPGLGSLKRLFPQRSRQKAFEVLKASPVGKRISARYFLPPMEQRTRAELAELFGPPSRDLAEFLGVDLSGWIGKPRVDGPRLPPSPPRSRRRLAVVAAVNDEGILARNLATSPLVAEQGVPLVTERGHSSAGSAYNAALDRIDADVVVFTHQDVYLPRGWEERLNDAIDALEGEGRDWAVLGVFGVDTLSRFAGRVWSSGLWRELGKPLERPVAVQSLDEMVIVLRRASGLRFDDVLPGFHLYGTDVVCEARRRGFEAFAFDGPAVHNSRPRLTHYFRYRRPYRYMLEKWRERLPIRTCLGRIGAGILPSYRPGIILMKLKMEGEIPVRPLFVHPPALSASLGYEQPVRDLRRSGPAIFDPHPRDAVGR